MEMSLESDDFESFVSDIDSDYLLALSLQSLEEDFNSEENKNRKSIVKNDYELALVLSQIEEQTDSNVSEVKTSLSARDVVSPQLELTDPNPNIWHLMRDFDDLFFKGVLGKHCIELSWSSRMTSTAGLCVWSPTTNFCSIRLSLPLLQLRSRKDLVETLIHEMIHALLFVTRDDDNHESHGQKFHEHMYRINSESGANITVYHNFHDEVNHFLKHIWRCDGKCRTKSPYFGYVRRSMNRKPGPYDYWFKFHEKSCGGTFIKISEPQKEEKTKTNRKEVLSPEMMKNKDIRNYLSPTKSDTKSTSSQIIPFSGFGLKLGSKESQKSLTKSDKNVKSVSNVNKIENYFKSDANNLLTIKESDKNAVKTQTLKTSSETKSKESDKPFEVFAGKGYVLGRPKPKPHNVLESTKRRVLGETTKSKPKTLNERNIEVIEID